MVLDPKGASQILRLLYKLNKEGITIVISTHDVDLVPLYASKVYIISEGKIIKEGTCFRSICRCKDHPWSQFKTPENSTSYGDT